ncbi:endonuclease/exonuclease/phosphatase family protein [Zhouia amylolytica]|uniref:Endonuclease/exonuclease/phosphatase domain-containing protein n=1 Tax=Zhouia amylolytica AD3 TaxID=1286632 RepID=W2USC6_9FLAO|nr:endonuclease/exonuclease/phosphatase family protein [Zhouia amylolytica]ETN97065.1 hypothetical protein P278_04910 [Zhouia amylolytica AD3]
MKKLNWFNRFIFLINSLFAALLLLSYALPYVFPKSFPTLSVFSLSVPIFITINIVFVCYWVLQFKRQFLLSLIILLMGYGHLKAFYRFSGNEESSVREGVLKVMSFNVRLFNLYEWIPGDDVDQDIINFVNSEAPDVICFQDFHKDKEEVFVNYPYKYTVYKHRKNKNGNAVFSKYPIINKGVLDFPGNGNNGMYVDLRKGNDTIRVYNLHLESHRINPDEEALTKKNSERLFKRIGNTFAMQQTQAEMVAEHKKLCHYKKIICGDFNNTSSSNIFKLIRGDMKDTFEEQGKGLGRTFVFKFFPLRIDFILIDDTIEVLSHKNYDQKLSDHYPIKSTIRL